MPEFSINSSVKLIAKPDPDAGEIKWEEYLGRSGRIFRTHDDGKQKVYAVRLEEPPALDFWASAEMLQLVEPATDGAAPRPWSWLWTAANASGGGHIYILDANGRKIGVIWGKHPEKEATADLIVSSVNAQPVGGAGDGA